MNIYQININHLRSCNKIDSKVMIKDDRPYIGVVLEINSVKYLAPLTSAKNSKTKLNNQTTLKMFDDKNNDFLGAIRFNNMIPCKEEHLEKINISKTPDIKYKNLLNKQYELINNDYKEKIHQKAIKVYNMKCNNPNSFNSRLCCDFNLLEEKLK